MEYKHYKIVSIKHAGTLEERGTNRTDGRYPLRIGRVFHFLFEPQIGHNAFLCYEKDSDGSLMDGGVMRTGMIFNIIENTADKLIFETTNSIWEFETVNDLDDIL